MNKLSVNRGDILQQRGDKTHKIYKVEKGLLRSYIIDDKGKEHIFLFAPENWIIADATGIEKPAGLYIDAVENSIVQVLEKSSLEEGLDIPKILKRLSVMQERIIMLMSSTAIERYEHFILTYPDVTERIPQRMIASFLGITPEALSRVRKEYFHKKV